MRKMIAVSFVVCAAFAATGCSAVGSAVGGVLSPKPPQVTVVNNLEAHPQVQTESRQQEPQPEKVQSRGRGRSAMEKVGIVTTSTLIGAGLGALAGDALDIDVASTALIGAGVGAAAGVAVVKE